MLHDGEFHFDDDTVARLIGSQMPHWADLPLRRLDSAGTAHVNYKLGADKLVRLPRHPDFSDGPMREAEWLPAFRAQLPLEIPEFLALGFPSSSYPSHWSVLSWIEGTNATRAALADLGATAKRLGEFVAALRGLPAERAPRTSYRGQGLSTVDTDVMARIEGLPEAFDKAAVLEAWQTCASAPTWDGPPTWFHGDLYANNLLARDGELVGVIDFEGCNAGDPSIDLIAGWWMFDQSGRETFRETIEADEPQWRRGRGWALFMAVSAIPYYRHSNPAFAELAIRAMAEVLEDW